jgi:hypothetical protein
MSSKDYELDMFNLLELVHALIFFFMFPSRLAKAGGLLEIASGI